MVLAADILNRFLLPIRRSLSILVAKALILNVKDETNKIQLVQIDLGNNQITSDVQRLENFGFSSNPLKGAQAISLAIAGNRDHQVVIVVEDSRYKFAVDPGDSLQYNTKGSRVHCKGDNIDLKKNKDLTAADGVVTGLSIDAATGIPFSALPGPGPGPNKNISSVVRSEL